MGLRGTLRRWHTWIGWIVGIPLIAWTFSGLMMVVKPIGVVRGEALIAEPPALALARPPVPPAIGPRRVSSLMLTPSPLGPQWIVRYADGGARRADPASGRLLPDLTAAEAARIVSARYTGAARIAGVKATAADAPPRDLRRPLATWQVAMSDGTRFYVDRATGEIAAKRTRWWRFYDLMWGIHIMDLKSRENSSNPLVIGFAAVALVGSILALILLPLSVRRRNGGARGRL